MTPASIPPRLGELALVGQSQDFQTPPGSPRAGVVFFTPPAKKTKPDQPEAPWSAEKPRSIPRTVSLRQLLRGSPERDNPLLGEGTHYLRVHPGMALLVEDQMQAPTLFQPTPAGLRVLADVLKRQEDVDLRVHEKSAGISDRRPDRVRDFLDHVDVSALSETHPVGVILSDQQRHAIPILLAQVAQQKYLLIFDSNSGGVTRGYHELARHYPNFQIRLNVGTRQADTESCITDAFEMLKQALQVPDLCQQIEARKTEVDHTQRFQNSRLNIRREGDAPPNFALFRLPESLCFVVQRRSYLEEFGADLEQAITVDGLRQPLGMHLRLATEPAQKVRSREGEDVTVAFAANLYLYEASRRHRDIIEGVLDTQHPG